MSEMMILTMFAMVSIMSITGVEISSKPNVPEQTAISKGLKKL